MTEARPFCYRCHKARSFCVCEQIASVPHRTGVTIVQHPRERFHPFGTARIANLALENSRLEVLPDDAPPLSMPKGSALLFPGDDARDLADLGVDEFPSHLVVLDGTWPQAKGLLRKHRFLRQLPRVMLRPSAPSRYRIRRPPSHDALSTVESIVAALRVIEPSNRHLPSLLESFDAMVEAQIDYLDHHSASPRYRVRREPGIPWPWSIDPARFVVCYAEGITVDRGHPRQLVCGVARRLTGESIRLVPRRTAEPPTDHHLDHMRIARAELTNGDHPDELISRWRTFLRANDILVAWKNDTFELFGHVVKLGDHACVPLRPHLVRVRSDHAPGSVRDHADRLGAPAAPLDQDRPTEWLEATITVVRHVIDRERSGVTAAIPTERKLRNQRERA